MSLDIFHHSVCLTIANKTTLLFHNYGKIRFFTQNSTKITNTHDTNWSYRTVLQDQKGRCIRTKKEKLTLCFYDFHALFPARILSVNFGKIKDCSVSLVDSVKTTLRLKWSSGPDLKFFRKSIGNFKIRDCKKKIPMGLYMDDFFAIDS